MAKVNNYDHTSFEMLRNQMEEVWKILKEVQETLAIICAKSGIQKNGALTGNGILGEMATIRQELKKINHSIRKSTKYNIFISLLTGAAAGFLAAYSPNLVIGIANFIRGIVF